MDLDGALANDVDGLLHALDEADAAVRAIYRQLAEDPGLASAQAATLAELHARRIELAQRLGLAMLAHRRASVDPPSSTTTVAPAAVAVPAESPPTPADTHEPVDEPPEPAPAPPPPPSAPASDAQLTQWKSQVRAVGLGAGIRTAPSPSTAWVQVLDGLMRKLGPPRTLDTSVHVIEELDALDDVAAHADLWARLPRHGQQLWLSVLVARTRALKELPSATPDVKARVKGIISRYPPWAKDHTPGHVHGMAMRHEPVHGSWANDARHHWNALDGLVGDELVSRSPGAAAAAKKKAKRQGHGDDDEPRETIDPTWRLLPLVRGRKAIILGGDPREPNRKRLEAAFQLASLEWPAIEGPRKVDALVERIGKGHYGLILVLQPFVSHKASEPIIEAAKDSDTAWALVTGYGVTAVKLGLERYLGSLR